MENYWRESDLDGRYRYFLAIVLSALAVEMTVHAYRDEFPAIKFLMAWSLMENG
jgi:hypothetical protein